MKEGEKRNHFLDYGYHANNQLQKRLKKENGEIKGGGGGKRESKPRVSNKNNPGALKKVPSTRKIRMT